jgi:SAM-dependent methyltransferase
VGGISFDRAADYYDATRRLPDDVDARVSEILHSELRHRGRALEIGVGTGRIALPLVQRGIDLIGMDLARTMLARLVAKGRRANPLWLVAGDGTALPLAGASVDAVLMCHVLHLVPDWRGALDEAVRVLRPHGVLLLDFGGPTTKPWSDGCDEILRSHGIVRSRPGMSDPGPVSDHLGRHTPVRALPLIRFSLSTSLADELGEWEQQHLAWTWPYEPAQIHAACDEIRSVAGRRGWRLDEAQTVPSAIQWWAFDVAPGRR